MQIFFQTCVVAKLNPELQMLPAKKKHYDEHPGLYENLPLSKSWKTRTGNMLKRIIRTLLLNKHRTEWVGGKGFNPDL